MEPIEGRTPEREQGASDKESNLRGFDLPEASEGRGPLRLCSACGKFIAAGTGRFNVGKKRYHVECFDATRHLTETPPPDPSA